MKTLAFWLLLISGLLLFAGFARAQSPPNGIPCNATGSGGAVSLCKPGWSYGCNSNQASSQILAIDGNRTSILFQDTGSIPAVLTFGDQGTGLNGFVVQPGNSFLWSNLGAGNIPGRVPTTSVSITSNGPSTCVILFTD